MSLRGMVMRTTSGLWAHFTGGGGTGTGSEFGSLHMYTHTNRDTQVHTLGQLACSYRSTQVDSSHL